MTDARSFYGRWAGPYDWLSRAPVVDRWRRRAVDALALQPGETAVEMGCGTGANLPHLRRAVAPDGRVCGVDLTREMVARARKRALRAEWPTVAVARGDATRPPVDGVDAVLATFVAGLFERPGVVVRRWCDALAPGGRIALLHFRRSETPWAAPLNAAYEGFVRLSAPGQRFARRSVARDHDERVDRAHAALEARTDDYAATALAGGYVRLASGRVV